MDSIKENVRYSHKKPEKKNVRSEERNMFIEALSKMINEYYVNHEGEEKNNV